MKSLRGFLLITGVFFAQAWVLAQTADAQTFYFGLDAGGRTDFHKNGAEYTSYFGGINISAIIAGAAGKSAALVIPIAGEARFSTKGYLDANAFADVAMRFGSLSVGAGGAISLDMTPDIPNEPGTGQSDSVIVLYPVSVGYSAFAKVNTGPQGRLFLQGRYTMFPASMSFQYRTAEQAQFNSDNNLPNEDVPALDNHTVRVAAGYAFGRTIIKAGYIMETWRYERVFDNTNGAYDRDSKIYSLGLTWFY